MDYKYTGIVLDKRDIGETDRLYSIYTLESGKIKALAKGVRKVTAKLAGNLENFTLADISIVKNQGTGKITASIVENNFSNLKNNFEALSRAFANVKILSQMAQFEEKDERLFNLLKEYLEALDKFPENNVEKLETVSLGFVFKLLECLGYGLEVGRCVVCGNVLQGNGENFFSAELGGVVCASCFQENKKGIRISVSAIKIIRLFFQNRLGSLSKLKIEPKDLRELKIVSQEFLRWVGNVV
jgi:DNA repair protein RecO (recombination protein O)